MQSQNGDEVHVLALVGSFRSGSFDEALIRTTRELAPELVRIGVSGTEPACCFEEGHGPARPTTEAPGDAGPLAKPKRGG